MSKVNSIPIRSSFLSKEAKNAWQFIKDNGYPHSKNNEKWRFSNPNPWLNLSGNRISSNINFDKEISTHIESDSIPIFITNEHLALPKKIPNYINIVEINKNYKSKIPSECCTEFNNYNTSSFIAENTAFFENYIVINILKNTKPKYPIHIIHLIKTKDNSRLFPRIKININSGSEVEIRKSEISLDNSPNFINAVTDVVVNENSHLKWINSQNINLQTGCISSFNISLKKYSSIKYNSFEFGGGFYRNDLSTYFDAPNGNCEINSLFMPSQKQHIDINTSIHHKYPNCSSQQLVKGILVDKATGVFRGLANVYKGSVKTNAQQNNKNLILSPNARVNSIPNLEIYEEDVKCSHGSTTGEIDENIIFYLRSRGINYTEAKKILVNGFANENLNKIEDQIFKNQIQKFLTKKLERINF